MNRLLKLRARAKVQIESYVHVVCSWNSAVIVGNHVAVHGGGPTLTQSCGLQGVPFKCAYASSRLSAAMLEGKEYGVTNHKGF